MPVFGIWGSQMRIKSVDVTFCLRLARRDLNVASCSSLSIAPCATPLFVVFFGRGKLNISFPLLRDAARAQHI